jgi:hypothetical protein
MHHHPHPLRFLYFRLDGFQTVGRPGDEMEMATFGGEAARDPFADALRRAGHQNRFAFQPQIHGLRLRSSCFRDRSKGNAAGSAKLAYNISLILAK